MNTVSVTQEPNVSMGSPDTSQQQANRNLIAYWLLVCCVLVFIMVVLGGVTRLTGSGLSMVRWEPVSGILPPLTTEAWEQEFSDYRESPEFKKINTHMDVNDFKQIFWLEYIHRVLGRAIGVVFLIPFLFFLFTRRVSHSLVPKLVIMFFLGGMQGAPGLVHGQKWPC